MDEKQVQEQIERVCQTWVQQVHPERILLLGFALNGKLRLGRDLEFLVVWEGPEFENNRRRAGYLGLIIPDDILLPIFVRVLTPRQFRDSTSAPSAFTALIAREAKVLHPIDSPEPLPPYDKEKYDRSVNSGRIEELIQKICRSWTEQADPEQIFLFGSTAREERVRDSDLDFLVVWKGEGFENNRRRAGYLMRILPDDVGDPVDVIVLTPEQFEESAADPRSFTASVLREGRILYERLA